MPAPPVLPGVVKIAAGVAQPPSGWVVSSHWPLWSQLGAVSALRCRGRPPEISHSASYRDTLIVKLVGVSISGITAALHARARSAVGLAVFGVLTGVSALAALFLGVLLAG